MRILLLSWEYPPVVEGGLARDVRKLSEELVQLGAEVHVLTRGEGRLSAQELRHGVSVQGDDEPPFAHDLSAFVGRAPVFGLPTRRITVIPSGIDPADLEPAVDDLAELRARFASQINGW